MVYYFPQQIFTEILKRLPIKSLLRFRCVEKSWYSLIGTPLFNTLRSQHQKNYLLLEYDRSRFSLRFDNEKGCEEYYSLEFPLPGMLKEPTWCAISNGLICLCIGSDYYEYYGKRDYYNIIQIWNPAIRKFITLPHAPRPSAPEFSDEGHVNLAFGFIHNDYKVVKLMSDYYSMETLVDVYTLSSNSWKIISQDNLFRLHYVHYNEKEVFVNGSAFWVANIKINNEAENAVIIVCFDIEKEVMRSIILPECCRRLNVNIFIRALGESLALFAYEDSNAFKLWVWQEDDVDHDVGFWKLLTNTISMEISNFDWQVIGLRNDCDLVILRKLSERELVCYNVEKNETKDFDVSNLWSSVGLTHPAWFNKCGISVDTFTESLFLLNTVLERSPGVSTIDPDFEM